MQLTGKDFFYEYLTDFFQDIEIRFRRNVFTGELQIYFTDEMAQKMFGFKSVKEMMEDKEVMKIMKECYNFTGKPLFMPTFNHDDLNRN